MLLRSPIDDRERRLARKGPIWRTPMAFDVLRNLPFLRHVPQRAVEVLPHLCSHPQKADTYQTLRLTCHACCQGAPLLCCSLPELSHMSAAGTLIG